MCIIYIQIGLKLQYLGLTLRGMTGGHRCFVNTYCNLLQRLEGSTTWTVKSEDSEVQRKIHFQNFDEQLPELCDVANPKTKKHHLSSSKHSTMDMFQKPYNSFHAVKCPTYSKANIKTKSRLSSVT